MPDNTIGPSVGSSGKERRPWLNAGTKEEEGLLAREAGEVAMQSARDIFMDTFDLGPLGHRQIFDPNLLRDAANYTNLLLSQVGVGGMPVKIEPFDAATRSTVEKFGPQAASISPLHYEYARRLYGSKVVDEALKKTAETPASSNPSSTTSNPATTRDTKAKPKSNFFGNLFSTMSKVYQALSGTPEEEDGSTNKNDTTKKKR